MNKIILLLFMIYNKTIPFIENVCQQEYSLICQNININCNRIHNLYDECGSSLFNLWFSLDLLLSVNVNFNYYDEFYIHLFNKINSIYNKILIIKKESNKNHKLDNEKLLFYINKIINHQIIKYSSYLLVHIEKCKEEIIKLIINSEFFIKYVL